MVWPRETKSRAGPPLFKWLHLGLRKEAFRVHFVVAILAASRHRGRFDVCVLAS